MHQLTDDEFKEYQMLKRIKDLENYAFSFWDTLVNEVFHNKIPESILPIHFIICSFEEYIQCVPGKMSTRPVSANKHIAMITIKFCEFTPVDSIKESIRHELIHFGLFCLNLKDSDFDAIFKILCDRYNARFYKKLSGIELKIYEECKEEMGKGFCYIDKYKDKVINCSISKIIDLLGDKSVDDINKLKDMKKLLQNQLYETEVYIEFK